MNIKYYKRVDLMNNVVGLGYIDEKDRNNMLFQMFEEVEYWQEEVGVDEFIALGGDMGFEGFKHVNYIIPASCFEIEEN